MTSRPPVVTIVSKSDEIVAKELERHGLALSVSEARRLGGILGRDPTRTEAFLFDAAWSEHCSYKSSRSTLKACFGSMPMAPHVLIGPGEDAGVVVFTRHNEEKWCFVLGHESHNHPSQVLPLEGAATGIGGIVRDVYCMGADVVGVLDALRFGDPREPRCAEIARGVIEGIWRYGNALGVPNLGGDVYFDPGFNDNCLVNVIALGVVRADHVIRSRVPQAALRERYVAILVGKPTDSSGFGGASFASADLDDPTERTNVGAVQVADPFLKRVLVEANRAVIDLLREERIEVGFKDLGAGGIGGASVELAAAGNMGIEILLDNVRLSEPDLDPEVILVSETQERFVWAVPERIAERVIRIYERDFELPTLHPKAGAVLLGRFVQDAQVTVHHRGEIVVQCATAHLNEGISYERKSALAPRAPEPPARKPETGAALLEAFRSMLSHPEGASRAYVYRHYDSEVQGHTVLRPGEADAAVIAPIPGCPAGLVIAVDGNPHRGAADPYQAGAWAVAGAVRNVVTAGGSPLALSDCLNFGSPENPAVFAAFREVVQAIADTSTAIGLPERPDFPIPIITGNVSFYNQSARGQAIPHSPIVGCVGMMPDVRLATDQALKTPGHRIVWAGRIDGRLGGSLYARVRGFDASYPELDAELERGLMLAMLQVNRERWVRAAHDVAEGGLLFTVFEMLVPGEDPHGVGARIDLTTIPDAPSLSSEALAFSESSAIVMEVPEAHVESVRAAFTRHGVPSAVIGEVLAAPEFDIRGLGTDDVPAFDLAEGTRAWKEGLERWLP